MRIETAVELALGTSPEPVQTVVGELTPREREVAALITRGYTNRQIASELVLAVGTVERHIANILNKLGLHTRAQVAVWATERGLVSQYVV
jgi:DNA-binding NarL/FixJ family response regulator